MKRGLFFPCLLLVSWIAGSISCSSPVSQKTDWRQRIDSVARINYNLAFGYPDSVRQILSHLPIPADDSINQYYLYLHYGRCYYLNDQMDSTLACMSIVENFCKRNPFSPSTHSLLAGAYNIRAVVYLMRNKRKDALSYLNLAYQHIQQADIRREMPNICVNAADICRQMGKLPQATAWYRRAMVAADSLQMPEMMHCIHTGLGLIYADLNNFEKAHFYLSIADTLYPPQTPYESYYFYNTRSNCYTFENKHLQALECSRKAYEFAKEIKQDLARATAEANIGETFLALGNIDSARYYLILPANTILFHQMQIPAYVFLSKEYMLRLPWQKMILLKPTAFYQSHMILQSSELPTSTCTINAWWNIIQKSVILKKQINIRS